MARDKTVTYTDGSKHTTCKNCNLCKTCGQCACPGAVTRGA